MAISNAVVSVILILGSTGIGILFAAVNWIATVAYRIDDINEDGGDYNDEEEKGLLSGYGHNQGYRGNKAELVEKIKNISAAIDSGAHSFLFMMYTYMAVFIIVFGLAIFFLLSSGKNWNRGLYTSLSFVLGSLTSIYSGYWGMSIAVKANSRVCVQASKGLSNAFSLAFRAGSVMGFNLVSVGLLALFCLISLYQWGPYSGSDSSKEKSIEMYEAVAGFGLGGSSIALFGRVGGGIYTKAADVGADLTGKVEKDIPEDDPRNPAVIADNVGDNVGDIAGMGADLFGSFAESSCAALVISSHSLSQDRSAMLFPLIITASGILICLLTSFLASHFTKVNRPEDIEPTLKNQLLVSTILMTIALVFASMYFLPEGKFLVSSKTVTWTEVCICACVGLWCGLIVGYTTEYYTSNRFSPVQEVASSCRTGAATNIIYGLALGYKSIIIPVLAMAGAIFVSFSLCGMYGVSMAALGILSTLATGLTIDAYGPICDNAGGIAEMTHMEFVRERTDELDAAGNTTAAIGKGFAIGSAAFVSLALFGAYATTTKLLDEKGRSSLNLLSPLEFSGLLVGAMLPYWFSAMTMKAVGIAAHSMVEEVREQFKNPNILKGTEPPNYKRCISISTEASLREMMGPGALVMLTPIIVGFLFGVEALAGVLIGSLISGIQMAISAANSGGAWDNAKKYIEKDGLQIKGDHKPEGGKKRDLDPNMDEAKRNRAANEYFYRDVKDAAVVGDTVGDPMKDTSGPSLNILIKLAAIISLVLAPSFPSKEKKGLLFQFLDSVYF